MTPAFQIPAIQSKLPDMGISIFSQMTALANEHEALNLAQGFPDFAISPQLIAYVEEAMRRGFNQYAPMPGYVDLREAIAAKIFADMRLQVDPDREVTITAGATQALFSIIGTVVSPGDEVLIFEPAYDSYAPSIRFFGGIPVPIRLYAPAFEIDWAEVETKITAKTTLIILNNPNNPSTKIWSLEAMQNLARLVVGSKILLLSDEVYAHICYDGAQHISLLQVEALRERSFVVTSFGKLLHATGWKVGYVVAPAAFTTEFRKQHQFNVFSVNAPMQMGIAKYLQHPEKEGTLTEFFQQKRDRLVQGLQSSRFRVLPAQGTYFLLLSYAELSDASELDFAQQLTKDHKLATIPISAFYTGGCEQHLLRLCFAKADETLDKAIAILQNI